MTDLLATGTGSNFRSLTLGTGSCAKMYAQRPPNHRHLALATASMESVLAAASAEKASKLLKLHSLSASRFAAQVHAMLDPNLWLCWLRLSNAAHIPGPLGNDIICKAIIDKAWATSMKDQTDDGHLVELRGPITLRTLKLRLTTWTATSSTPENLGLLRDLHRPRKMTAEKRLGASVKGG